MMRKLLAGLAIAALSVQLNAMPFNVGSFNVESIAANLSNVSQQIVSQKKIDIWGLCESNEEWAYSITEQLNRGNKHYDVIYGSTGSSMARLQIIFDNTRFKLIESFELDDINVQHRVRAPLVARFYDTKTKKSFLFMVNHLYRSNDKARHQQAVQLNQWASEQIDPIVAVGDYNFDLKVAKPYQHDLGLDNILKDGVFTWVQPEPLIKSQCSNYNSVLDFIFVSAKTSMKPISSSILFPEASYCTDKRNNSDHRPLQGTIDLF